MDAAARAVVSTAQKSPTPGAPPFTAKTRCNMHPDYPCLNAFAYAVSQLVPTAGGTTPDWTLRRWDEPA